MSGPRDEARRGGSTILNTFIGMLCWKIVEKDILVLCKSSFPLLDIKTN